MKSLGIYFGPQAIMLVECDGAKVSRAVPILHAKLTGTGEGKVPDEIKIAAAIKDELRKASIDSPEANIVLLGRDLIIRTFQMPLLRPEECAAAVKYEAKKYIPFKVEELVYDYQLFMDKVNRKTLVLFVGVKRESLDKYVSIFAQLNVKVATIEYAGFSTLRLLQLAKVKERGVVAVVSIDPVENDEVNFIVLENGFPLFSRDIILTREPTSEGARPLDAAQGMEELKVELRISLDFYLRKFPTKNINTVICIAPDESRQDLDAFIKERGILARFVDVRKLLDKPIASSLGTFKAFAVAQAKTIKSEIKIDLLPSKIKAKSQERPAGELSLFGLRGVNPKILLLAAALFALPFGIYFYRMQPVKQDIAGIINKRPKTALVKTDMSLEQMSKAESQFRQEVSAIIALLNKRTFLTGQLDAIPRVVPEGLWLRDVVFRSEGQEAVLTLKGSIYLGDGAREQELYYSFVTMLSENKVLSSVFPSIKGVQIEPAKKDTYTYYNFVIECRSKK